MTSNYRLWSASRGGWCDYELDAKVPAAMRALYPADWDGRSLQLDLDFHLVPEAQAQGGAYAVSVRTNGLTVGYITDKAWTAPVLRIAASGLLPITNGHIWARETDRDEVEFDGTVRLNLGAPAYVMPVNDPPAVPYTLIPRGGIVQVIREEEHSEALLKHVPGGGRGALLVTLHERVPDRPNAKAHVEVRIDDERIGQLTPQTSQRFLPMVQHFASRGLRTAAVGDIEGSPVAAEVRVDAAKANEVDSDVLDGPPVTVPCLVPSRDDLSEYDVARMAQHMAPTPPPPATPIPAEPADGSVIKFARSRYTFLAIRRGPIWQTTASGDWGPIRERMAWADLARRAKTFEIAAGWDAGRRPRSSPS